MGAQLVVPLDLVGLDAFSCGGRGEIANANLPAFMARHRCLFSPVRYTRLSLAVIEAMMIGMPVIGLATTELATMIRNEHEGYLANALDSLVEALQRLLRERHTAQAWSAAARDRAQTRLGIARFVTDLQAALATVCERHERRRA